MSIIYPMFALVVVTFVVGLSMGAARLISVNNFSNLLEVPILFYILGVLLVALDINNSVILILAWCFVALRIVHSVIHITYNHPKHRFYAFLTSSLIVLAMWVQLIILIS